MHCRQHQAGKAGRHPAGGHTIGNAAAEGRRGRSCKRTQQWQCCCPTLPAQNSISRMPRSSAREGVEVNLGCRCMQGRPARGASAAVSRMPRPSAAQQATAQVGYACERVPEECSNRRGQRSRRHHATARHATLKPPAAWPPISGLLSPSCCATAVPSGRATSLTRDHHALKAHYVRVAQPPQHRRLLRHKHSAAATFVCGTTQCEAVSGARAAGSGAAMLQKLDSKSNTPPTPPFLTCTKCSWECWRPCHSISLAAHWVCPPSSTLYLQGSANREDGRGREVG